MNKQTISRTEKILRQQQIRLGLQDWHIELAIGDPNSYSVTNNCRASIHYKICGRAATLELNPLVAPTKSDIIHELLHLLFADFSLYFKKDFDADAQSAQEHSVIRRLEDLL